MFLFVFDELQVLKGYSESQSKFITRNPFTADVYCHYMGCGFVSYDKKCLEKFRSNFFSGGPKFRTDVRLWPDFIG